jgi:hypothetical protein
VTVAARIDADYMRAQRSLTFHQMSDNRKYRPGALILQILASKLLFFDCPKEARVAAPMSCN